MGLLEKASEIKLYSYNDIEKMTGVKKDTLLVRCLRKKIKGTKINGKTYFNEEEVAKIKNTRVFKKREQKKLVNKFWKTSTLIHGIWIVTRVCLKKGEAIRLCEEDNKQGKITRWSAHIKVCK